MEKVCIAFANGCPRSRVEIAKVFEYFQINGFEIRQSFKAADMVVVATCGVSQRAQEKSERLLSRARARMRPGTRLFVVGCLAGINPGVVNSFGAKAIKPTEMNLLDDEIKAYIKYCDIKDSNLVSADFTRAQNVFGAVDRLYSEFAMSRAFVQRVWHRIKPPVYRKLVQEPQQQDVFSIKIARGCMDQCSYCAIRFAEGELCSKKPGKVIEEFEKGLESGYRIFTLVAGDTGAYGQDIGTDITELLESIFKNNYNFKLHIKDFGPRWLVKYEARLMAIFSENQARIGNIMLPVQSGSEKILKAMNRNYTAQAARESLCRLRRELGHVQLSTHVLVGFPGETEEDFEQTLEMLEAVRFDRIDIYTYSDRPGTESSLLEPKIPAGIVKMRVKKLTRALGETAEFAC